MYLYGKNRGLYANMYHRSRLVVTCACIIYTYIHVCPPSTHDVCFLSIESGGMWLRTPAAQGVGPSLFKGSLTITDTPRDTFIDMRVHVYNTL